MDPSTQEEKVLLEKTEYGTIDTVARRPGKWAGRLWLGARFSAVGIGLVVLGFLLLSKETELLPTTSNLLTTVEDCEDGAWMDDMYTPAACGIFDARQCEMHCTSDECLELCGEACETGAGAVCALSIFSPETLKATCEHYGYCDSDVIFTDDAEAGDYLPRATGTVPGVTGGGCDNHAWCLFCAPYKTCSTIIPAASNAMIQLGRLATNCRKMGCGLEPPNPDTVVASAA